MFGLLGQQKHDKTLSIYSVSSHRFCFFFLFFLGFKMSLFIHPSNQSKTWKKMCNNWGTGSWTLIVSVPDYIFVQTHYYHDKYCWEGFVSRFLAPKFSWKLVSSTLACSDNFKASIHICKSRWSPCNIDIIDKVFPKANDDRNFIINETKFIKKRWRWLTFTIVCDWYLWVSGKGCERGCHFSQNYTVKKKMCTVAFRIVFIYQPCERNLSADAVLFTWWINLNKTAE